MFPFDLTKEFLFEKMIKQKASRKKRKCNYV